MANRKVWSLEAHAYCRDCDWVSDYETWKGSETVGDVCDQAARHANEAEHTTSVENMRMIQYSPGVEDVYGFMEINHPISDNHPEAKKSFREIMKEGEETV